MYDFMRKKGRNQLMKDQLMFVLHSASAFQYLKAGVNLGLFDCIGVNQRISVDELQKELKLPEYSMVCLLFGAKSLNLIVEDEKILTLSESMQQLWSSDFWPVFVSMIRFQSEIVYLGQSKFEESLLNGENRGLDFIEGHGANLYQRLEGNIEIKKYFYEYMEKYSDYSIKKLLQKLPFEKNERILDVGCGKGMNSLRIIESKPPLFITMIDLPFLKKELNELINERGLRDQLEFITCDFLNEAFPRKGELDTVLFIHQLVIWSKTEMKQLLVNAYKAVRSGGRVVVFSSMSNDDYNGPVMSALDSVYFKSIASGRGMIYSWRDYEILLSEVGFHKLEKIDCAGWTPHGIIVAYKE